MTSLLRLVSILMVVCLLLAEGLLVEAKGGRGGGRGRSRGGYIYGGGGGGGGDFPVWAIPLICVFLAPCLGAIAYILLGIWVFCAVVCMDEAKDEKVER